MRPCIDTNDFATPVRAAPKFLADRNRVKVSARFRRRAMCRSLRPVKHSAFPRRRPDRRPCLPGVLSVHPHCRSLCAYLCCEAGSCQFSLSVISNCNPENRCRRHRFSGFLTLFHTEKDIAVGGIGPAFGGGERFERVNGDAKRTHRGDNVFLIVARGGETSGGRLCGVDKCF